jgi:hypothetical protein
MSNKPVPPNGFKALEEFEPCPECGHKGHGRIGQQKRCSMCGRLCNGCCKDPPGQKF